MKTPQYVALSAFASCTRFAIDAQRIGVVESLYTGCIEVHLTGYDHDTHTTLPGGVGLVLAGQINCIRDGQRLDGRYALIAGFDEVFAVACHYDGVVVLRPLGIGLGVRWQLHKQFAAMHSRKRRTQKKHAARAHKYLRDSRCRIAQLTGTLPEQTIRPGKAFFLRERTKRWQIETPLDALTLEEARQIVRRRIARMVEQGWQCGEESSVRGTIQRDSERTVAWLCLKANRGASKWLSIECGEAQPVSAEDRKHGHPSTYSSEQIVEMCSTWANFNGFSGEHCGNCHSDANVFAYGPGWFCGCGHYNVQSWNHAQFPHDEPDYGPKAAVIRAGIETFRRQTGDLK